MGSIGAAWGPVMGRFISRFAVDSVVRVGGKPYFSGGDVPGIAVETPGFVVAVFDRHESLGGVDVPAGLLVNIQNDAPDIESALRDAAAIAGMSLSGVSCASVAAIGRPRPLWAYDASPDLEQRDYRHFIYDTRLLQQTRQAAPGVIFTFLARFFDFLTTPSVAQDRKNRVMRAIAAFRRGIADNDDVLTEFLIHWTTLETLDVVYREACGLAPESVYTTCVCGQEYRDCPNCGRRDLFLRTTVHTGIKQVFSLLGEPDKYDILRRARNGISHGYEDVQPILTILHDNLGLTRKAVILMLMEILGVKGDETTRILGLDGFKGKFLPYMKVFAQGSFEPADVARLEPHPLLVVRDLTVRNTPRGDVLSSEYNLILGLKNAHRMQVLQTELWGDASAKPLSITMNATVIPEEGVARATSSGEVSDAPGPLRDP